MTDEVKDRLRARGWTVDSEGTFVRVVVNIRVAVPLAPDVDDDERWWWHASIHSETILDGYEDNVESACIAAEQALEKWLLERLDALRPNGLWKERG